MPRILFEKDGWRWSLVGREDTVYRLELLNLETGIEREKMLVESRQVV